MSIFRAIGDWLIPVVRAQGQAFGSFTVTSWGYGDRTWQSILGSIVNMLKSTITMASVAVFVTGAFLFAISAGDEKRKSNGKNMMIGALWALGIVLGAQAILRTASYFVWG
ncbi:MAG: hypothetical protein PHO20_03750 [Candidatus Peribacteraceae bacterium]|nr:hypothetical protein [Candidatus Peribacteraceae bacterium]MDD5739855.1 hypothetical protein [Candidatus Peribacteraceae bacterium]